MKVKLPENISEITLDQFQRFMKLSEREDLSELDFNKRKIEIFTNLKRRDIKNVSEKDYTDILSQLDNAINTDVEFINKFTLMDVEFGFHPNLDDMTTAEFVDLTKYGEEIETLHNTMAILFRPISNKDSFGNYQIAGYNGTKEYADLMKQMPLNIVNGALFFFSSLAKELRIHTQKYTTQLQVKVSELQTILENGDGTPQSVR